MSDQSRGKENLASGLFKTTEKIRQILLMDADSKMPNLALMKISAWHKAPGDKVFLNDSCPNPDKVYISCVFPKNASHVRGIIKMFSCPVEIGGYGVNGVALPNEIEHTRPDYDLYGCDFSMGFTSRGCIRNCPWCIVPKKEGMIRDHAPISEFLHPDHDKVILLDNNFLASPKWRENLQFIIDHGLKVNFNQGLDIRLVNDENAAMLADTNFQTWHFNKRRLHIAWDRIEDEAEVKDGISELFKAGVKGFEVMCYMLCAYGISPENYTYNYFIQNDMNRFEVLRELGVDPYVMVYNDRKDIPILRHFERWVNWRVYKADSWENYDHGDSQEVIRSLKAEAEK